MGTVHSGPGVHLVLPTFNPAFFVASISDTLTKAAAQPPWNFRPPGSCSLQTQVGIPPQWDSPHALSAPGVPDSMSDAQALQFRTGRRGAGHAGVAPAKVLADSLHASLHSAISPQQHVLSMIQHHLLPALILAQQRVAERLRSLRPKRNRGDKDSQNHDACAYVYSGHGPRPSRVAQKLYESARSLERGLDPLGAAEAYELAVQADPRQSEWFSLIAKNMSDATFLSGVNSSTAQQYNQRAIEFANQALALAPDAAHPYISRCVSRGRLALFVDNRTKVHLARDASEDAAKALAIEPNNDWAHHLMGRFHFEMAGLNAIARTLVRILFGTALMEGSYQEALKHYRVATQISPTTLVHRAELGRTLVKLGKHQEALTELQEALLLDVEDINAHLTKIETAKLVKTLMNSPQGRLAFLNVPIQPPAVASVKIEEVK